jgi:hypothetical protein
MYIKNPLIDKTRGSVDFSWQCLGSSNLLLSEKKKLFIPVPIVKHFLLAYANFILRSIQKNILRK